MLTAQEVLSKHKISLKTIVGQDGVSRYTYSISFYYPRGKKNVITGKTIEIVTDRVEQFFKELSISFDDLFQMIINDDDYFKSQNIKGLYQHIVDAYKAFAPFFKEYSIDVIEPEMIIKGIDEIKKSGKSTRTTSTYTRYLKRMFKYAFKKSLIHQDPSALIDNGDKGRYDRKALSEEEIIDFVDIALHHYTYRIFGVYVLSGIPSHVLVALSWKDVDFDNNLVHVRKRMKNSTAIYPTTLPKSAQYDLKQPQYVMDILKQELVEQSFNKYISKKRLAESNRPVFPNLKRGKWLSICSFTVRLYHFMKSILHKHYSTFDIQLSAAVLAFHAGCDMPAISDIVAKSTVIKMFRDPQKYGCPKRVAIEDAADYFDNLMDTHNSINTVSDITNDAFIIN